MIENQTGDFERDAGSQAKNGLGKQSLDVLELMKNTVKKTGRLSMAARWTT